MNQQRTKPGFSSALTAQLAHLETKLAYRNVILFCLSEDSKNGLLFNVTPIPSHLNLLKFHVEGAINQKRHWCQWKNFDV